MKKSKDLSFDIDGDHWVGSEVFTLTSYGLPVRVVLESVHVLFDNMGKGTILGYFSAGCKFCDDKLMTSKQLEESFPSVLNIPDFKDYITYEIAKTFNRNKKFITKYEDAFIIPYSKPPKDKK